jgi:hypothetical protein
LSVLYGGVRGLMAVANEHTRSRGSHSCQTRCQTRPPRPALFPRHALILRPSQRPRRCRRPTEKPSAALRGTPAERCAGARERCSSPHRGGAHGREGLGHGRDRQGDDGAAHRGLMGKEAVLVFGEQNCSCSVNYSPGGVFGKPISCLIKCSRRGPTPCQRTLVPRGNRALRLRRHACCSVQRRGPTPPCLWRSLPAAQCSAAALAAMHSRRRACS